MRFSRGPISGQWIIDLEAVIDHRGFFARTYCSDEFAEHGMNVEFPQQNMQHSPQSGTMRGLHYQAPPHTEAKLVRCTAGAVYDVTLDVRPHSDTYRQWSGTELRASEYRAIWVPPGCAHGYVTLEPNSEVYYLTSHRYVPDAVRGIRYDDPAFEIEWPIQIEAVPVDYDNWPDFTDERASEMAGVPLTGEDT